MMEPRSTATIRALASLAELSANQLEEGVSVDEVIATLRRAAEAVKLVVDADEFDAEDDLDLDLDDDGLPEPAPLELVQDLTPMDLSEAKADEKMIAADRQEAATDEPVLNAG